MQKGVAERCRPHPWRMPSVLSRLRSPAVCGEFSPPLAARDRGSDCESLFDRHFRRHFLVKEPFGGRNHSYGMEALVSSEPCTLAQGTNAWSSERKPGKTSVCGPPD